MNAVRRALLSGVVLVMTLTSAEASPISQAVDPRDYPKLTEQELGHIRRLVKMAHQLPGDWSGYASQLQITEGTHRFQVAFGAMALALAQHQYTPAYKEMYKGAIEAFVEKMQHQDIWERWLFSSRAGARGGLLTDMGPGWMDPVAKDDIMLKGYLLQLGAAHDMLYGDHKYDQPGAFTFSYHGNGMGNGLIKFRYTLGDVAENIYQEVVASDFIGSACEPGRIFWTCQAPSSVGFMHYDQTHGTHYADVLPKMRNAWTKKGFIDPRTYRYGLMVTTSWEDRAANQETFPLMPMNSGIGGWAGMFNHAWDAQFAKAAYYGVKGQDREDTLQFYLSGAYAEAPAMSDHPSQALYSTMWGLFLNYAAEVGDREAVDKMLAYAERNYHPVWDNGEYYYPRNDDFSVDAQGNSPGVDPWTGNVLIALARLNQGGGFYKLYNEPWGEEQYRQPYISDVDTLTTGVSQAFYDEKKDALIVTLSSGPIAAKQVQFAVRQLDPAKTYAVIKDGKAVGHLDRTVPNHNASMKWREDGSVLISTDIAAAHTFVFSSVDGAAANRAAQRGSADR